MKKEKLALYGGVPVRESVLQYGKQSVDENDIKLVADCLRGDYLTTGPTVKEFEELLAQVVGSKYAVAVASGTAALHVAALAAGIGAGDEVITTPLTFAASANCALYCGAKPVFADIDPNTYLISPADIERKITSKTKAIIPVHYAGVACDMDAIHCIAEKHGLTVIEDAAHAIGTTYQGAPVGGLSDMTEFSFHPVKTITTGEGGGVTTNDLALYEKLLLYRTHGITRDAGLMEDKTQGSWYYEQLELGYNYRITDMQCALGLGQLQKLKHFQARRKELVAQYDTAFSGFDCICVQKEPEYSCATRHLYTISLRLDGLSVGRKEFFDALSAEGIGVNVHYIPVYWFPYYQRLGYKRGLCPVAEQVYESLITVPLYPDMTDADLKDVICAVQKVHDCLKR